MVVSTLGWDPGPGVWAHVNRLNAHVYSKFKVGESDEEVKARIGNAIGPNEDLLTSVKRRKLKRYGHVTRSSGLAKTILQGTAQGGRRRGRHRNDGKTTSKSGLALT